MLSVILMGLEEGRFQDQLLAWGSNLVYEIAAWLVVLCYVGGDSNLFLFLVLMIHVCCIKGVNSRVFHLSSIWCLVVHDHILSLKALMG